MEEKGDLSTGEITKMYVDSSIYHAVLNIFVKLGNNILFNWCHDTNGIERESYGFNNYNTGKLNNRSI